MVGDLNRGDGDRPRPRGFVLEKRRQKLTESLNTVEEACGGPGDEPHAGRSHGQFVGFVSNRRTEVGDREDDVSIRGRRSRFNHRRPEGSHRREQIGQKTSNEHHARVSRLN